MFRVDCFPTASTKSVLQDIVITEGGCSANAAIAIARLGGRARFAGPLGDDTASDRIVDGLARVGVDSAGVVRVAGAAASISAVFVDDRGERLLATKRDQGLGGTRPADVAALLRDVAVVLADNHFADFLRPIAEAARRREIPVVLDLDRPTAPADPLFAFASHVIFSAEALRVTTGATDMAQGLERAASFCRGFVAATDGARGAFARLAGEVVQVPAFPIKAVDTLAAGDVFHAGFALALAEGAGEIEAMQMGSAAAALKCEKFGGIAGAPSRAELEEFLRMRPSAPPIKAPG